MVYAMVGRYSKPQKSNLSLWLNIGITISDPPHFVYALLRIPPELLAIFACFRINKQLFAC
jgi:hypothetical protein